jgi:UDPglucose 6-dehydrogenase
MDLFEKNYSKMQFSTSIVEYAKEVEVVFIIVPTPSTADGSFSNSYLIEAVKEIGFGLRGRETKTVVNIVSTVMPGSCQGVITKTLEEASLRKIGQNLAVCYNPEFIALGSVIKDMSYPDMHLLGSSHSWAADILESVLRSITKKNVPCQKMNLIEAELVKISVNNFVTMKIAFANSLLLLADYFGGIDIDKVTTSIGLDSRIGGNYLKAAVPFGGPCFPRDTRALTAIYEEVGINDSLSLTTETLNNSFSIYLSNKIKREASESSTIGILGLSYKMGTPVIEESPGLSIASNLIQSGMNVLFWDDEGAAIPNHEGNFRELADIIEQCDYLIITRPLKDINEIYGLMKDRNKKYLDLWRQVK